MCFLIFSLIQINLKYFPRFFFFFYTGKLPNTSRNTSNQLSLISKKGYRVWNGAPTPFVAKVRMLDKVMELYLTMVYKSGGAVGLETHYR